MINLKSIWKIRLVQRFRPFIVMSWYVYRQLLVNNPIQKLRIRNYAYIKPVKLNMGCGRAKLSGWINIDIEPGADLILDIRKGLTFSSSSVDFIYCEHVLEHFTREDGKRVLEESKRCLKKGGTIRIAMPDLDFLMQRYADNWRDQDWLSWSGYKFIKTKGQMINIAFRSWGHMYLYNEEDLKILLNEVGFERIGRQRWNESNHHELRNLETRKDSILIMEAEKID